MAKKNGWKGLGGSRAVRENCWVRLHWSCQITASNTTINNYSTIGDEEIGTESLERRKRTLNLSWIDFYWWMAVFAYNFSLCFVAILDLMMSLWKKNPRYLAEYNQCITGMKDERLWASGDGKWKVTFWWKKLQKSRVMAGCYEWILAQYQFSGRATMWAH